MRAGTVDKLAIGLPVYNGENYLDEAIASMVSQTYRDFVLIISDNGSTDGTEILCRQWAEKDQRIVYHRHEQNQGAAWNFNYVFELSNASYFKWIAHDDRYEPGFLEACVTVLDNDPTTVLACTRALSIDWEGYPVREWGGVPALGSADPAERLRASLQPPLDPVPLPLFGVIRSDSLSRTGLMRGYAGCDRVLLAELSLFGRFRELPEALFLQREHSNRAGHDLSRNPQNAATFWKAGKQRRQEMAAWQALFQCLGALTRAPLTLMERVRCALVLPRWVQRVGSELLCEVMMYMQEIPLAGSWLRRLSEVYRAWAWTRKTDSMRKEIESLVPERNSFVLVDDGTFVGMPFPDRKSYPFMERDGAYWGAPERDDEAIQGVEALRRRGATRLVIVWPAFWWLDYYVEWAGYLRDNFLCVARNARMIVFDLNGDGHEDQLKSRGISANESMPGKDSQRWT